MSCGIINTPEGGADEDVARVRAEWDRIVSDRRRTVVHTQDPDTGEWHAWGPPPLEAILMTLMAIDAEEKLREYGRRMFAEDPWPWEQRQEPAST